MFKFSKAAASALGMAMLAAGVLTTVASAAPVPPKNVNFGLNNQSPGTCPAKVRLIAKFYAKSAGSVQLRFELADGSMTAPVWVPVVAKPSGLFVGKYEQIFPAVAGPLNFKARAIVSGAGKTKRSKWDRLKIKC